MLYGVHIGTAFRPADLVEVARLELAASWSLTMRATNCATPGNAKIVYYTFPQLATPFFQKFRPQNLRSPRPVSPAAGGTGSLPVSVGSAKILFIENSSCNLKKTVLQSALALSCYFYEERGEQEQ